MPPPFVVITDADGPLPKFTDEELWQKAIAVTFTVNKTNIKPTDPGYRSIVYALQHVPVGYTFCRLLVIRGSASPEGPAGNNRRLAHGRAQALADSVRRYVTLPDSAIEERYIDEDYIGLRRTIEKSNSPYRREVMAIIDNTPDPAQLKLKLQRMDGGRAWRELLRDIFPSLRATRVVIVVSRRPGPMPEKLKPERQHPSPINPVRVTVRPTVAEKPRRELLAVKTNLLMDAAWMPNYGFCPMPNIEVEYYPRGGHWTFGGSFDMPWWQSSAYNSRTETSTGANHKFFQARQYQLLARWYVRDGGSENGFHGLYFYPYVNLAIFGIGFKVDKGWMGEGAGGGLGVGYKLPLGRLADDYTGRPRSKASHWHLEFALQFGAFAYKYDPYQWGCPRDGINDGRYYYRYTGDPSLFRKRNHHKAWFGPTRAAITLSYDLLYRKGSGRSGAGQQGKGVVPTPVVTIGQPDIMAAPAKAEKGGAR